MKRSHRILSLLLALVMLFALTACGSKDEPAPEKETEKEEVVEKEEKEEVDTSDWPSSIVISAGPVTGSWYTSMTKISEVLMREIPGLSVTVIEGTANGNLDVVNAGVDAQLGLTNSFLLDDAKAGKMGKSYDDLTAVMPIVTSYLQCGVPASSDIYEFADLVGKDISAGLENSAATTILQYILESYGLSYADVEAAGGKIHLVNYSEYPTLMTDGHLDAACLNGDIPNNNYVQIETSFPVRMLSIDEENANMLIKDHPALFMKTFPAGTLTEGTTEDCNIICYSGSLLAHSSLPDSFLIEIMNVINDNVDEIVGEVPFIDLIGWENTLMGSTEVYCRPAVWQEILAHN